MPARKPASRSSLCIAAATAALAVGWCRASDSDAMYLCQGTFALCTSAPCMPVPNTNQALCACEVLDGKSMAGAPCDTVAPGKAPNGTATVYSMFSLAQFNEGKRVMFCGKDQPWTWCLDKPCTVDPADPTRAACLCDIVTSSTEAWLTLGGGCDTATCSTAYWSGATLKDFDAGTRFMQSHGQDIEPRWCAARGSGDAARYDE